MKPPRGNRPEDRRDDSRRDARRDPQRDDVRHEPRQGDARREQRHGDARREERRGGERRPPGRPGIGSVIERVWGGAARRDDYEADRERDAHLYGLLPVLEALRAGNRRVERVTVAEGAHESRLHELFELARAAGVPVRRAPRAELQRMAAGATHQGVIATVSAVAYADADELLEKLAARARSNDPPLAVVLDGVEDPRNLGAIIRTAECAGVDGLFIPERRAAGLTETVAKAAAGALEYLPVARAQNVARLVEDFKERGVWTVGTDADANIEYTDWDWTQPCALLLGGEGAGLRRLVRERCDALVRIPLRGRITSLNVSVAAGIVLYEALRQRTLPAARP
ncbi:MAG TPA: 23S rRNA (guanosine(2251)-2'-O)-methyltransferase RlmB [Pyrinomonadaceae bacterium]|nr:23S rRNA (guanosine(2251)-2'-O)-methyltransferase RlmB [Pyrinomonadaceae bacterium]